jgi:hypothetical protein
VVALGISGAAHAQRTTSESLSGAQAGAIAAPTFNFSDGPADTTSRNRLTTTPSMTAPNFFSSNPCVIGASGAVSAMGFGMALGAGIEDRDCTRRANAAILAQMNLHRAAAEVLCHNTEVRAAMAVAGMPCAADRAEGTIMPNPPMPPGPTVQGANMQQPPVQQVANPVANAVTTPAPRQRPDWCMTASPAERARSGGVC